jgi:surface protein
MKAMFDGASSFNGNISSWNTAAVTDMSYMFHGASSFNPDDLSNWDTSAVASMKSMFDGASSFNGNILNNDQSKWDTSAVTNMIEMFKGATSFSQNLCAWKDSFPYSNATHMFKDSGCTFKDDPTSAMQGPFCASSCTNS